jgi:hypothetical protein
VRVTSTGYDDPDKPTSNDPASDYRVGWKLRQPITTTTDPGSAPHLDLKSITRYDKTTGLVIETRMPANPAGGDAHSSKTIYYTGDTSSGDSACNSKPQFANLACKTLPAVQPGTTGLPNLPVTQTSYNRYNQPTTVTETVGTTTRTTTTSYDTAGRTTDLAIASTVGTALPTVHTDYDPTTGQATVTSTADASGTATIIRGYDTLGRLTSYQDADSTSPATTTYDLLDRPATVSDGKGTQTLTYDTSIDPRGLATSLADSAAGTFTARYDPDGNLTTQGYPNGMEARTTIDPTGSPTELAYVKMVIQALAARVAQTTLILGQQRLDHRPQLVVDLPRLRPCHPRPPHLDQPDAESDPTTLLIILLEVLSLRGGARCGGVVSARGSVVDWPRAWPPTPWLWPAPEANPGERRRRSKRRSTEVWGTPSLRHHQRSDAWHAGVTARQSGGVPYQAWLSGT